MTKGKRGKYTIVGIATICMTIIYLIYYRADVTRLISMNSDINVDLFVWKLINGAEVEENIFAYCEYNFQNLFIYAMAKLFNDGIIALNVYYLLSFWGISLLMFMVLQKYKCSFMNSLFGAILLAFLPYHIERGQGQIVTSSFYVFIIFALIISELFIKCSNEKIEVWKSVFLLLIPWTDSKAAYMIEICMLVLCLCMSGKQNWKKNWFYEILLLVSCIMMTVLTKGRIGTAIEERLMLASEEGMRILDMLVPVRYHVMDRFFNFRYTYDVTLDSTRECGFNSVGTLLAFFFIYSLFVLLLKEHKDNRIARMAWINVIIILISSIDGVGYLFEYFGCYVGYWNRMTIMIIINLVVIMVISMDKVQVWLQGIIGKNITYAIMGVIEVVAFLDIFLRHSLYFA